MELWQYTQPQQQLVLGETERMWFIGHPENSTIRKVGPETDANCPSHICSSAYPNVSHWAACNQLKALVNALLVIREFKSAGE